MKNIKQERSPKLGFRKTGLRNWSLNEVEKLGGVQMGWRQKQSEYEVEKWVSKVKVSVSIEPLILVSLLHILIFYVIN